MAIESILGDVEQASRRYWDGEYQEMRFLGMIDETGSLQPPPSLSEEQGRSRVPRAAIKAPDVLNEAYKYAKPSSFSRGLRVCLGDADLLLISGTASIDEEGRSIHIGDFRAQLWRTYRNITQLLKAEGASWQDIVRTSCYLRDIERDYKDFNEVRTAFFEWLGLDPLPASTGIQARLCREELLVEIEAIAVLPARR
ncbi:MAG TPA: Rid family hydrolase [Fimbriimonadaceae bacterium]|nr:Rid family hydrolase [Fimbriimonadaceae bacterium]